MLLNSVTAKIALRDLDLFFKVKIKKSYISQTVRDDTKMCDRRLDIVISIRTVSLRKFYSTALTYLFGGQNLKMLISMKLESLRKMHGTTFKDFDIFQRMLHLMTLTYIFKVNNLKCLYQL